MIETEAWVLHQGDGSRQPGQLVLEQFSFSEPDDTEVLAEPLYGTWEGNMTHAMTRNPVDVCRLRMERRIVLGNAGVVRVVETGKNVTRCRPGDVCVVIPIGKPDSQGYPIEVYGYDNRGSVGLLAKRTKLREDQLIPLPRETRYSLLQWAGTSVRYATAWDNWRVTWACWRSQWTNGIAPTPHVWGWGGGVALAELLLAKRAGCRVAMIASNSERLRQISALGITPVDRREFLELSFDAARHGADIDYRTAYAAAEVAFLRKVRQLTDGQRVSIFIDNIGTPVLRATLKALARYGVLTTVGWEGGTDMQFRRPTECIGRHIHIFTHGSSYEGGDAAIADAEAAGEILPVGDDVYDWARIPQLAEDFAAGRIRGYFPIYKVNGA
ncbi:zinc-binding dehydrogenase [Bradyrhizobium sp. SZCCHNRI1009]|uniref:zinc-binding dehydrogenase n=1 Tax=Bradyrhizobium sp. SZCCHNRI1009 TaxID=3057277 RepID=UPI002916F848|nr:zinc-binding dehydrogenase [Bradyrhizobium sp. SZCCHNRI1009]